MVGLQEFIYGCIASAGALGAGTVVLGLRGRRVDDHPTCRRCAFDLFGTPPGRDRCGECGAVLSAPRAVRFGNRRRRPAVILLGVILLLPAVAGAVGVALAARLGERGAHWKPTLWLANDVVSSDAPLRDAARRELVTRLRAGAVSTGQAGFLAHRIIAVQARPDRAWDRAWGDLMEEAKAAGVLGAREWSAFAAQSIEVKLEVRPRVGVGEPLTFKTTGGAGRTGTGNWFAIDGTIHLAVDGREFSPPAVIEVNEICGGSGITSSTFCVPGLTDDLRAGEHELHVRIDGRVTSKDDMEEYGVDKAVPIVDRKVDLYGRFTVLPAGESSVAVVDDNRLRSAVHDALRPTLRNLEESVPEATLCAAFHSDALPIGFAGDVFVRVDGREWHVDRFACAAGDTCTRGIGWRLVGFHTDPVKPVAVDVIFRASRDTAVNTLDVMSIFGGEIVLTGVPVTRQGK